MKRLKELLRLLVETLQSFVTQMTIAPAAIPSEMQALAKAALDAEDGSMEIDAWAAQLGQDISRESTLTQLRGQGTPHRTVQEGIPSDFLSLADATIGATPPANVDKWAEDLGEQLVAETPLQEFKTFVLMLERGEVIPTAQARSFAEQAMNVADKKNLNELAGRKGSAWRPKGQS